MLSGAAGTPSTAHKEDLAGAGRPPTAHEEDLAGASLMVNRMAATGQITAHRIDPRQELWRRIEQNATLCLLLYTQNLV